MDSRDLDPPVSSLHRTPNEAGVVAGDNNKLVAVFDVGVGERDLRLFFFYYRVQNAARPVKLLLAQVLVGLHSEEDGLSSC